MIKRMMALAGCLLLAGTMLADPPIIPSEPVKAAVGDDVEVEVTVAKDKVGAYGLGFDKTDCTFFRGHSDDSTKMVFLVRARKPGKYRAIFWTVGEGRSIVLVIDASGPVPPVPPIPPIPPVPPDPPSPVTKAWVVVIEDSAKASDNRAKWFRDQGLSAYIKTKGWTVRVADKDVRDANGNTPADIAPYIKRAAMKTLPQVYVVDQDGAVRFEGQLPATPAEALIALKKVGGE